MANDTAMVNGSEKSNNSDANMSNMMANGQDQSLKVMKNSAMSNGVSYSANRTESYSNSRTTRRSEVMSNTKSDWSETQVSFSKEQQITVLQETVISTRRKLIAEFGHLDEAYIQTMTIERFLEYIERQRLTYMPHRGSRWDKVLKWAEFFALQISGYGKAVGPFVSDSKDAIMLIFTASCALLELGPDNAQALEKTFGVFYQLGLSLSYLLRHNSLLHANPHIRMEVGQAFNDMLMLVRDVTIYYHARLNDLSSKETSLDFTGVFGQRIEAFHERKNHITDAMWEHELRDRASMDVGTLRSWLSPRDRTLRTLFKKRLLAQGHRDEYTCEWFQRPLLDFSRSTDDVLTVSGPAGCGKSVLSGWIIERLQRLLGKKFHETLSYAVEVDIPGETTSLAVVKHLLLQLLEKSIGNIRLFEKLEQAYNGSSDANNLENVLWECLDVGLDRFAGKDHLMMIIDGVNEVKGGLVTDRLARLASKHGRVQAMMLSSGPAPTLKHGKIHNFEITVDHTHEDLRHITEHALHDYVHFKDQSEHAREAVIEQLLHAAHGNFLWIILTTFLLRQESSHESFTKAAKAAKDAPKNLEETIKKVTATLDFSGADTNLLLSWMLVVERPLTVTEAKYLLQVDLQRKQILDREISVTTDILNRLKPLVVLRDGNLRFRHAAIRSHLMNFHADGKKLRDRQTAQTDLTMRLLAYCRFNLTKSRDPGFELIDKSETNELFTNHPLLEYAVRNWVSHFRASSMHSTNGSSQLSADFKAIFPSSTQLAMLEWTCWDSQTSTVDSIQTHELALQVRQGVFGEKHVSVLQNLIICGSLYRNFSKTNDAGTCFYRASRIGQSILRKHHTVVIGCTTSFLAVTESVVTTTRTEFVTRKEEMLRYVIDTYIHQHGKTHDLVIRYYKMLAQMYIDIHEEHQAEIIWREVREIVTSRFGKGSQEEISISENLTIVLKKGDKKTDVVEYERGIFDIAMELEVWNIRRIKLTLELAVSYEARGEFFMAEELYITLWRRLTEQCHHPHHHHGVEIHISTIDVVLEYVRFLRRCHRHEEASNILICIWTEYEEYDFESETIFLRLKIVGELMRTNSLLSVAIAVFKKCLSWFRSHGKHEHTTSCEILISETIQEIITTTSTTSVSTTTSTTTTTETVIKEFFESTISRTTVTSETMTICKSLISYYMNLEQWSEAIEVTRRSLSVVWRLIISGSGTIALPRDFGSEAIDIAIRLAVCYHRSHQFHEAEEIYIRIYRACRKSCNVHDERLTKSYTALIKFYEEHFHWHQMIEIYRELLVEFRKHLGVKHTLTIQTLYTLGSLCADHGHGHAHEYYEEIITTLNQGSHVCHHDAIDAMIFICRSYYEGGLWQKLKVVCKVLWETWRDRHHGHEKFSVDFIEILYLRYRYVLEHHMHCEITVLRELTIEYRNTCIKVFGASATITIKASIQLAQIFMMSETHVLEAISIYEEVLTTTKTTTTTSTTQISTTTIATIKERLTKAYVAVCSHKSVSTTTIERAIRVVLERFESLKITLGCSHIETLASLRELVLLYMKVRTQESYTIVMRMLLETTIEIISKEVHSKALHEAAKIVGGIYISCEMPERGQEMIQELRLQIITGTALSKEKSSFKLGKSIGKVSYVFLVTFEQVIRGQMTISYSEIMADLLTETILYESYNRCLKIGTDTGAILSHAARLRVFLLTHQRRIQIEILENQSYDVFVEKWGSSIKAHRDISFLFYIGLLEEFGDKTNNVQIGNAACVSSIAKVRDLLERNQIQKAYEVALFSLEFINHQRAYHQLQNVGYGFKLSALMAGRGLKKPLSANLEPELHENMLKLSRNIIREVLKACKDSNISFDRMQLRELNDLVGLLGEQQNHTDLEWLLNLLWSSREVQKTWSPDTIISIGRRFVQARFLTSNTNNRSRAIRLCEDICYNLRRVWGSLDPKTLEMSDLLSELYTTMGHYREAMGMHENILRLVVEGDDGDDRTLDTMPSQTARKHVEWLKQSYLRLKGWDKSPSVYKELVDALLDMPEYKGKSEWQGVRSTDKWTLKEQASDGVGKFVAPREWEIVKPGTTEQGQVTTGRRPGMAVKRATSNWGLSFTQQDSGHNGMIYQSNGVEPVH